MHLLINSDVSLLTFTHITTICTDPPYGATQNKWDAHPIDFVELVLAACKDITDANLITTADMRYACFLLAKHPNLFSHDLVWSKTVGSGQLNIKRRPLRTHENILIFKIGKPTYNRIFTEGQPYSINRKIKSKQCYGQQVDNSKINEGQRDTKTILHVPNPRVRGGHPTQKPVALFQKLCDIYNKQDGVVLDMFCGSGTVLDVQGHTTIGAEVSSEYYRVAVSRRKERVCEKTPERIAFFKQFVPNLEDCEYTIFDPPCP